MRLSFWPRSLFGRLIAALIIAVVLAQAASLYLFARNLERFVLDSSVREWSRRITEMTLLLEQLPPQERAPTIARLKEQAARLVARRERRSLGMRVHVWRDRPYLLPPIEGGAPPRSQSGIPELPPVAPRLPPPLRRVHGSAWPPHIFIQLPLSSDLEGVLRQQLRADLGNDYDVSVHPAAAPGALVIPIPSPFFGMSANRPTQSYDVSVRLPDSATLVYRVTRIAPGTPLPTSLMINV
ncbi:MAG: hypothetical protein KGO22_11670, partial [Gammaproteobacteria bacterium]|nr:hypothetical protein [Gammaproteobacteria bacterium]